MPLHDLSALLTPAALLDEARMAHNIRRMQQRIQALGVTLRPHVKTAKCVEVGRAQRAAGAVGITVSTLKEAEVFFDAGFSDILYAVCITPNKLPAALALRARGCALRVVVDSVAAAQAIAATGQALEVLIEIDTDGHRAGVLPEADLLLEVGRTLHLGGAVLQGVMTHAGASYACRTPESLRAMAEQERSRCVRAAERLRAAGLPCAVVSVGSTPTALSATQLAGVTEVRAGVYVFQDLVMQGIGVCTMQEIALSVLTTVIGHQTDKGWVLVDAGWMAMSRDRGTQGQAVDWGYGAVCDEAGNPIEDLLMDSANQEHGILARRDGRSADPGAGADLARRFPIGSRLRILPNHACATAAQFPAYTVLQADGSLQSWPRFIGW
jgi:D-serine deaminase-like pyridoxal phosphate-dependent protein